MNRQQISRALKALTEARGSAGHVAWLIPAGVGVRGGPVELVEEHTWQDVADNLASWLHNNPGVPSSDAGRVLVREFLDHLEEEGVAVTDVFGDEGFVALSGYARAVQRIHYS